jgi:hypothetical protein
LADKL